jgi:hypothetical protein
MGGILLPFSLIPERQKAHTRHISFTVEIGLRPFALENGVSISITPIGA